MRHNLQDKRGLGSLPVVTDWIEWWRCHGPRIAAQHGRAGWVLLLLDAQERIQETAMLISRLLRNKPSWNTEGWSEAEWLNVEEQTAIADAWFQQHAGSPMRDAPPWAQFLFSAQAGNLAVLKRLGRELRAVQAQGYYVATLERRPGEGIALGGDAAEVVLREAD